MTKTTNAVVLATDNGYLPAALFVAHQLASEAPGCFDIVILHTEALPPLTQQKAPSVRFIPAKIDPRVLEGRPGFSPAFVARLLVAQLLSQHYRKLLYLDCDVWINRRSIAPLFDLDLEGVALAAVRDAGDVYHGSAEWFASEKRRLGLAMGAPLFNSGVLLIDRAQFAAQRVGERALEAMRCDAQPRIADDQSALNAALAGQWRELSPIWNWQYAANTALTREFAPRILHFIGSSKPWADVRARYPAVYGAEMAAFITSMGIAGFARPAPALQRARRAIARSLKEIGRTFGDRRDITFRRYVHDTAFWDEGRLASAEAGPPFPAQRLAASLSL